MRKNKLKSERGSITLFVLISCLFFIALVVCMQMNISNKQASVEKEYKQLKSTYEADVDNMNSIYSELKKMNISFERVSVSDTNVTIKFTINAGDNAKTAINSIKYRWAYSDQYYDYVKGIPEGNIGQWQYAENASYENTVSESISHKYNYLCVNVNGKDIWFNIFRNETIKGDSSELISQEDETEETGIIETTPYLPTGEYDPDNNTYKFSKVEETNLDDGLVIQDSQGNEYVWVEVPTTIYENTAYNGGEGAPNKPTSSTDYDNIEICMKNYSSAYRDHETGISDIWYSDTTSTGWFSNDTSYNTAKQNMLKSVYENGGFWVGRYETGADTQVIANDTTRTAKIQANKIPYNYVTRTEAQVIASKFESGEHTSSLMFGIQWDLMMKFIEVKGASTLSQLYTDSSTIGNYYNVEFKTVNGNAKYSTSPTTANSFITGLASKSANKSILLTTGAIEDCKVKNIYDVAGNIWELTLENKANETYPCVCRGGGFSNASTDGYAGRRGFIKRDYVSDDMGFRVTIY